MQKQHFNKIICLLILTSCLFIRSGWSKKAEIQNQINFNWNYLCSGIAYTEIEAPVESTIADSKISIIRIHPDSVEIKLYLASMHGRKNRSMDEWAETFDLNFVFNAGMYSVKDFQTSNGYACSGNHINNPDIRFDYGGLLAFNPKYTTLPKADIIDLNQIGADSAKKTYTDLIQNIRMIDFKGFPVYWKKDTLLRSSMIVAGIDLQGRIIVLFSRSPYHANQMTDFMLQLPLQITKAVYLEGGPEAGFYLNTPDTLITKVGSYVTRTFENNLNQKHWRIPNVVGVKLKKK